MFPAPTTRTTPRVASKETDGEPIELRATLSHVRVHGRLRCGVTRRGPRIGAGGIGPGPRRRAIELESRREAGRGRFAPRGAPGLAASFELDRPRGAGPSR